VGVEAHSVSVTDASLILGELAKQRALIEVIAARVGVDPGSPDEFSDIDPSRVYEIPELVDLRGGSRQSYYLAINSGRLREVKRPGRKGVRGSDFINYLRTK
jgi:hypothetical protein